MNNTILFLDIDGVLNSHNYFDFSNERLLYAWEMIDPSNVSILNKVVRETSCDVVLSSMWRLDYPLEEVEKYLKIRGAEFSLRDKTPFIRTIKSSIKEVPENLEDKARGLEIEHWIRANYNFNDMKDLKIAIVDDISNMNILSSRLVLTNPRVGLREKGAEKIIKFLSTPINDLLEKNSFTKDDVVFK